MVVRIYNGEDLRKQFEAYDRDYYSDYAYEALLEYYDETYSDYELNVIEICETWNEYDDVDEISHAYPQVLDVYEWVRNYYDDSDTWAYANADDEEIDKAIWNGDIDLDNYYSDFLYNLEDDTTVIPLDDGGYLVEAF